MLLNHKTIIIISLYFISVLTLKAENVFKADTLYKIHEPVIVTANRYEKSIFETCMPSSVLKVSTSANKLITIEDALYEIPGTNVTKTGPWSIKPVLRGLSGSHVLTLIDGLKMNVLRSYGNHAPLIDIAQINRIEVIRGPGSVMYGSDAVAGVINIIRKQAPDFTKQGKTYFNTGFEYNSVNNQCSETADFSASSKNISFILVFNNRSAGNIKTPNGVLNNTGYKGKTLSAEIYYKISNLNRIRIKSEFNRMTDVGVPVSPYAEQSGFKEYFRNSYSVEYSHTPRNKSWSKSFAKIFYQTENRNFNALFKNIPKGTVYANSSLEAKRDLNACGFDIQTGKFLSGNNLLIFGADGFHNFNKTSRTSDSYITDKSGVLVKDPPADYTPPTPESFRQGLGMFIEDEWEFTRFFRVTAGIRYDFVFSKALATPNTLAQHSINSTDHDFSGSLGILYSASDYTHFFFNVGRAFKSPTLQERYFKGTSQIGYLTGKPELLPETSLNLDSGVKFKTDCFSGEISLFRNFITDFIVMEPINAAKDTFKYSNIGRALLFGGEFCFSAEPFKNINFFATGSYSYGDDINLNSPLPMIPPANIITGIKLSNKKHGFYLRAKLNITAAQNRTSKNESNTPGYIITDISFGTALDKYFKFLTGYKVQLQISNLFNIKYRNHLSYVSWAYEPGTSFSVSIFKTGFPGR